MMCVCEGCVCGGGSHARTQAFSFCHTFDRKARLAVLVQDEVLLLVRTPLVPRGLNRRGRLGVRDAFWDARVRVIARERLHLRAVDVLKHGRCHVGVLERGVHAAVEARLAEGAVAVDRVGPAPAGQGLHPPIFQSLR